MVLALAERQEAQVIPSEQSTQGDFGMEQRMVRTFITVIGILSLLSVPESPQTEYADAVTVQDIEGITETYEATADVAIVQGCEHIAGIDEEQDSDETEESGEQEDTAQDRQQVEEAKNRCLIAYFGYIPTDEEIDLFYRTVQAECGNTEPDDGIGAVADVIANRCRSDIFPDTLTEVITQENQFTTWGNGAIEAAVIQPWVYEICDDHISEGAVYDDIYYFTAGYYNPYCEPAFVIGNHYFGR